MSDLANYPVTPDAPLPPVPVVSDHRSDQLDSAARIAKSLFIVALIAGVGLVAGLAAYSASHSNRIYQGVAIAGIPVGGLTKSEARDAVRADLASVTEPPIVLTADGQEFVFDPEVAGIAVDVDGTVDAAYAYGRQGSLWQRSGDWVSAIVSDHSTDVKLQVDMDTLDATLRSIAPMVTRPAKDAFINIEGGNPEIVPELPGFAFDAVATRNLILAQLESLDNKPVELVRPIQTADVVVADLEPALDSVSTALSSPLVVSGLDQYWGISQQDLERIISVGGEDNEISVDREAVAGFVNAVADEVDRSPVDASIAVNSSGILAPVAAVEGISVDREAVTNDIVSALSSGISGVTLTYATQDPRISDAQAIAAAEFGETMLNTGVTVTWPDGTRTLTRGDLLAALTIRINPENAEPFTLGFDTTMLKNTLDSTFTSITQPVVEPRLRLVDGEITIAAEGKAGQVVNADKSVEAIVEAALRGSGEAALVIETKEPLLSVPVIDSIKLDDLLATASTYYGDSSDARRLNVERAAELEDGWLIAPGEVFSYAEFISPVDEENGFVTGFGIIDDPSGSGVTTAPVIGGGICQVSTTIFQAGFWAGLDIVERYSHPYWIQSYGEPPRGMQGLDAMVNIEPTGSLDLRLTNTTGNWIAIEVVADGTTVTASVYGVDPGWTVDVGQPTITAITDPPTETRFTDSPELAAGEQLQVEYAQKGFTSEITRVITDADGTLLDSTYVISTYAPSQNTILRGTAGAPAVDEATPES